jgi:phosphoribosylformylglycinamidine synthase
VISGNVSFYNENEGRAIPPTPTIAMVGVLDDVAHRIEHRFQVPGDLVLLVRTAQPALAASEYGALFGSSDTLTPIDLGRERRLVEGLIEAARRGLLRSAHDVADGGFVVALCEACFTPETSLGAAVEIADGEPATLFGEGASTIILSAAANQLTSLREAFAPLEVVHLGHVTATGRLIIRTTIGENLFDEKLAELKQLHDEGLAGRLDS